MAIHLVARSALFWQRAAATLLLGSAMMVAVLVATAPVAMAKSIKIDDRESGHEAGFLAIKSARFSNGDERLRLDAVHPTLNRSQVDRYAFSVYVDRRKDIFNRRTFLLVWQVETDGSFDKGLHLYRTEPGMEGYDRVRCRGARMKRVEGKKEPGDKAGRVAASIPQHCVAGTRSVQFHYEVRNFGGNVVDTAPGHQGGSYKQTRWIKRG